MEYLKLLKIAMKQSSIGKRQHQFVIGILFWKMAQWSEYNEGL